MNEPEGKTGRRLSRNNKIGESVYRIEDDALLRGRGAFIDDLDVGLGIVHAGFLRSQYAHAQIKKLNVTDARHLSPVVGVYTAADFPEIKPICADFDRPGFVVAQRPVLASERVRFVGDAIAMVITNDPYSAADAIEAIEVEFEPLPNVTDAATAVRPNAPLLHAQVKNNVIYEGSFESPE